MCSLGEGLKYPQGGFEIGRLKALKHIRPQTRQLLFYRACQRTTLVRKAEGLGAAIIGVFAAADDAGVAQLVEQAHQCRAFHAGRLRDFYLMHAVTQARNGQQWPGTCFRNFIGDQCVLANASPLARGGYQAATDSAMQWVDKHESPGAES